MNAQSDADTVAAINEIVCRWEQYAFNREQIGDLNLAALRRCLGELRPALNAANTINEDEKCNHEYTDRTIPASCFFCGARK